MNERTESQMARGFPVGESLPAESLAIARTLPRKPAAVTLNGERIILRPLDLARDAASLFAASNGQPFVAGAHHTGAYDPEMLVWRYLAGGPFADVDALSAAFAAQAAAADGLALCVCDRASGVPVGVVNYMNNFPEHLKVELGNIWYSPAVQRTGANTEATYLLLSHAFDLGYRRVEWKCDALNARSRRAAERMGFRFEGIQQQHFIVKGRTRDTAWFRILASEWPEVRGRLRAALAR